MKKIVAVLLALSTLFFAVSCAKDAGDAPQGYKLASNDALCDYVLYVPEVYVTESNQSNYTIATISNADKCTVSVAKLDSVYAENMDAYWAECKKDYAFLSDFTVEAQGTDENGNPIERVKASVGTGETLTEGWRYVFTGSYNGTAYKYQQIFLVHGNVFSSSLYCITFTTLADHYDSHLEIFNQILGYFYFK
ncbi:MAG: hypothetical protein E7657_04220 [Ruminococcaceae bacterium]|nr:hypothetical protein [Oscillospiraceae bacterium]